jgi:tetratricopeptide (TPR) repeat protein
MKNLASAVRVSLCALGAVAFAVSALAADKIPITTSSEEARQLYLKGRDLSDKLRATDAHALFEHAAVKDPTFALAQVGIANNSGTAKEFFAATRKAVALADKASEPERLVICALDAGAKGEPARQQECLTKLVQAVPDDERAHNQLAQFLFGRQDYAASIAEYKKATSINPQFSAPYNQMGYAYRFMGQYPEAEQAFKKYIVLIPGDPNPYDSYAELLMKTGRFEESIKNYEKALAVDSNFISAHIGIGNNYVFMGKPEEARKSYAKLAAVSRNDGEKLQAHFWTAMSYVHEGATDKALAEVDKMAAIDQAGKDLVALSGAQSQMGDILLEAGRIDEAAKRYQERVATIDKADAPDQVKAATHRQVMFDEARLALARHDVAGAKAKAAAYATAVATHKIPAEVRQTHELAGRIALEEKKGSVAVTELAQANQEDPRVLYLLAVAHQAAGDPVKAKLAGVQAADFNGLSPNYGYVRGKAKAMVTAPKKD